MSTGTTVRTFTPEQAHAIGRREGPMLLSANAGSGKTSVLAERFVAAVRDDGIDVGALLAITFTEKAAGELRARVRRRFVELGEPAAARDTEGAWIGTIHGFCARILRAHAVTAGLDPAFTVLDEATARTLRAEAFDAAFAALLADVAGASRTEALDLAAAWTPDRLQSAVAGVHDVLRSQGATLPRLPAYSPRHDLAAARATFAGATRAALEELRDARALASIDKARELLATAAQTLEAGPPARAALDALGLGRGGAKELRSTVCDAYRDAHARLVEALDDEEAGRTHALLDELLVTYARAYAEGKRVRSALDYDDLELGARDLLAGHPAVAARLRERFGRIMVDEFQDTNRLQLELLGFLDAGNVFLVGDELQSIYAFRHADVAVFRAQRERHARLGAAPVLATNWRSRPELLATINGALGAGVHPDFVALEAGRTDADASGAPPRVELLLCDEAFDDPEQVGAELDAGLAAGMPQGVKRSRLAEARAVARRLRALVDAGQAREQDCVVLLRAATQIGTFERALEREGFATLAAGGRGYWLRQPVVDLTAYLAALVNPLDELALYSTLASPLCGLSSDGLAHVAGVARGASGAWAALEAPMLHAALNASDLAALRAFLVRFGAERTLAAQRSIDELIGRAVTASGYDLHVLRLPGGRRRLANVHKLSRLAATYEERFGRDLRGFIDHARAEVEADAREAEAPVELGEEPAVRLMTIHAAKGLEFGTVVLADLGRGRPGSSPDLLVDGDRLGLRLVGLSGKAREALAYGELKREARAAADAEERRVVHVAVTRAEDRLLLSGTLPLSGDEPDWPKPSSTASPLSWIGPRLGPGLPATLGAAPAQVIDRGSGAERVHVAVTLVAPATAPATLGLAAPPPPGAQLGLFAAPRPDAAPSHAVPGEPADPAGLLAAGLTAALTDPDGLVGSREEPATAPAPAPGPLSYSGMADHARCGYRFYLRRVLHLPEAEPPPHLLELLAPADASLDPRVRGSVAHAMLEEHVAGAELPDLDAVAALGERFGARPTPEQAAEVRQLVASFLKASPVPERLEAATRVRVEAAFAFALDPGRADAPLLHGFVDVLAEETGGNLLVVDYKTDRLRDRSPAELVERDYAIQRAVYALAALQTGAARVEVLYAFLERPTAVVGALFGPGDVPALRAQVEARAAPIGLGRFEVTDEPWAGLCASCPGRGGLCSQPLALTDRPALNRSGSPPSAAG